VDGHDLNLKQLTPLSQSANEATLRATMQTALGQINTALDEDRHDAALKYLGVAEAAGTKAKIDKKKLEALAARKAEIEKAQAALAAVTSARQKLKETPTDAAASLLAGEHSCFVQGDWQRGLPLLARGSDPVLAALAKRDLALPADPREQQAIGDGWLQVAKKESGRRETHLCRRAAYWYELAQERFPAGADRDGVLQRLQEALAHDLARPTRLVPGSFQGRTFENRTLLLREGGGTMQSEEAVQRGLEWLANHQSPAGYWSMDNFALTARCSCGDPGEKHDVAATAFALMAFLGAGEAPGRGPLQGTPDRLQGRQLPAQPAEGEGQLQQ
jgi:hypothetical protein